MSEATAYVVSLALLLVGAVIIPWLAMRALVPTLETSSRGQVENYAGRPVVVGLGLVWLVWSLALLLVSFIDSAYASLFSAEGVPIFGEFAVEGLPFVLILGTLALGMADDFLGSSVDKGFRGHLSALFHGRLTTGALKLLGIGLLAAFATMPDLGALDVSLWVIVRDWVLQVLAIALTANLINLTDLRPGRALKVYSLLSVLGCIVLGFSWAWSIVPLFALILLGPVIAVWSFDVHERAMLGDAGANVAGALVGWMIGIALMPWWWALAAYVVVVFTLNFASERVSFSGVIDKTPVLRWLDGLGRQNSPTI